MNFEGVPEVLCFFAFVKFDRTKKENKFVYASQSAVKPLHTSLRGY